MLDEIWKEMNSMTGRRNLGARLFNVSSMLSNFVQNRRRAAERTATCELFRLSGGERDGALLGSFQSALCWPQASAPKKLEVYEVEEGTGVDIDAVNVAATLVLEPRR